MDGSEDILTHREQAVVLALLSVPECRERLLSALGMEVSDDASIRMTSEKIGRLIGLSAVRVRQIEKTALRKLKLKFLDQQLSSKSNSRKEYL